MLKRYGKSDRARKHRSWQRQLAAIWKHQPIEHCECRYTGCFGTYGLSPAHSRKRRFIETKEQYFEIVAACSNCHRRLDEQMSHDEMEQEVKRIIEQREV